LQVVVSEGKISSLGVKMAIDGSFYRNDIRTVLKAGPLKLQVIKSKLISRGVNLDEMQILEALDSMVKAKIVVRTEGKFALVTA
jgi:hypothetical protein